MVPCTYWSLDPENEMLDRACSVDPGRRFDYHLGRRCGGRWVGDGRRAWWMCRVGSGVVVSGWNEVLVVFGFGRGRF